MSATVSRRVVPVLLGLLLAAPALAQENKPLWSGRFDVEPNKALLAWGASFSFDKRLFEDDVLGSLAWAEAITRAGVLNAEESHGHPPRPELHPRVRTRAIRRS